MTADPYVDGLIREARWAFRVWLEFEAGIMLRELRAWAERTA